MFHSAVPVAAATIWTRLLPASAMYRSPANMLIAAGAFKSDAVAALLSPPSPHPPVRPAITYISPAVIEIAPHWVPLAAAISTTRQLPVSEITRSPAADTAAPSGWFSSVCAATVPLPDAPTAPVGLPATV